MRVIPVGFQCVQEVGFSPDDLTLIALGSVPVPGQCEWHSLNGAHPSRAFALRHLSKDSHGIAPRAGTVLVCDSADLLEFRDPAAEPLRHSYQEGWITTLAVSPSGEQIAWAKDGIPYRRNRLPPRLYGYNRRGTCWEPSWQYEGVGSEFGRPVYTTDGERLAVIERRDRTTRGQHTCESTLLILNASGQLVGERSFSDGVSGVAPCNDRYLLWGGNRIVDVPGDDIDGESAVIKLGRRTVTAACAEPHGRWLLTACQNRVVVFDTQTWQPKRTLDWKIGSVRCLAVSHDGTVAAAGGSQGRVVVWDVE